MITLGSNASLGAASGSTLVVDQPITDGGAGFGVTVNGQPGTPAGAVTYSGATSNTYTGQTQVVQGTFNLDKTGGAIAVAGPLTVGDGASGPAFALWGGSNQLPAADAVTVLSNGTAGLQGNAQTVAALTVTGGQVTTGPAGQLTAGGVNMTGGTITAAAGGQVVLAGDVAATSGAAPAVIAGPGDLNLNGTTRTFAVAAGPAGTDLVVTAPIVGTSSEGLTKTGTGVMELDAANSYTGPTTIAAGTLRLASTGSINSVSLTGGTLAGTGAAGEVSGFAGGQSPAVGVIAPELSGTPNVGLDTGDVTMGPQTTLAVQLSAPTHPTPTANVDYTQLNVTGNADVTGAALGGSVAGNVQVGDTFTILQTTGTVSGEFASGTSAFINGQKFGVTYNSDSVVLTKVLAATSVTLGSTVNPSADGQTVMITATVTPEAGAAAIPTTDTVTFTLDGVTYPAVPVNASGVATFDPQAALAHRLITGSYTITAHFNGDNVNAAPSDATPYTQVVNPPAAGPLVVTPPAISPNNPTSVGVDDVATFTDTIQDFNTTVNWTLTITSAATGAPVRVFTGTGTAVSQVWDGTDGTPGGFVPDGTYTGTLTFVDADGQTAPAVSASVVVDNTSPTAGPLVASNPVFSDVASPGAKTTTTFTDTLAGAAGVTLSWSVTVTDANGNQVQSFTGTGTAVSATWNGADFNGNPVPEGAYTATLTFQDSAGNQGTPISSAPITTGVIVDNTPPATAGLNGSTPNIAPADPAAGAKTAVTFSTVIADAHPGPWAVTITDPNGNVVQTYTGTGATVSVTWNGQDATGAVVPDGGYTATLTYSDAAGNAGSPATAGVVVYDAGPTVTLATNSPTVYGTTATFTATVSVLYPSLAKNLIGGTVQFASGSTFLGSGTIAAVNGQYQATFSSAGLPAGAYNVTAQYVASANFNTGTSAAAAVTVSQAPLTVTANNQTAPIGQAIPSLTYTATGLLGSDTLSGSLATTATAGSPAGAYAITQGTLNNPNYAITFVPATLTIGTSAYPSSNGITAVGAGAGGGPLVNVYNPDGSLKTSFTVFDPSFTGGVRVTTVDFNGDGVPDYVVGSGPGMPSQVEILDGKTGAVIFSVQPFESTFTGGVFVAAGDLTGKGYPDLIVTPDEGGGPVVVVYDGAAAAQGQVDQVARFFGIQDPNFRGGARAAVGDLTGAGYGDLIVSAGFGGGPRVAGYDGLSVVSGSQTPTKLFADFFAFEPSVQNGAYVAVGDVNGDGKADLILGAGPGGGPRVLILDGSDIVNNVQTPLANFFAGDPNNRSGVPVAAKDLDGSSDIGVVAGDGAGDGSTVTAYTGQSILAAGGNTPQDAYSLDAFPGFTGGVYVG
ncbi:beta strand repeat-containing protein [Fimbriiglobus ruber]|uniref:Ribose ABC transport system, periplasmic ribose-binding protein RbsB n=1 Tax=Fimbriiglobus ruber TaxID=1908690 RepID=A0A225DVD1_9BACT|nr:Ig-like domain repeat protein [Fimbriiglobus ruber]OWK41576.1 Ribose ABC transport system, periplasmic ribose-binding protein RbsB [Fimbriiglobus ruber]